MKIHHVIFWFSNNWSNYQFDIFSICMRCYLGYSTSHARSSLTLLKIIWYSTPYFGILLFYFILLGNLNWFRSGSSSSKFGRVLMMVTKFEPWQTNLLHTTTSQCRAWISPAGEVRTDSRSTCADYRFLVCILRKFFSSSHFVSVSDDRGWTYLHFKFCAMIPASWSTFAGGFAIVVW